MFGMSQVGEENLEYSTPYEFKRDAEEFSELRPLTRSMRNYLMDYDPTTLPSTPTPGFLENTGNPYFNTAGAVGYGIMAGVGAIAIMFALIMFTKGRANRSSGYLSKSNENQFINEDQYGSVLEPFAFNGDETVEELVSSLNLNNVQSKATEQAPMSRIDQRIPTTYFAPEDLHIGYNPQRLGFEFGRNPGQLINSFTSGQAFNVDNNILFLDPNVLSGEGADYLANMRVKASEAFQLKYGVPLDAKAPGIHFHKLFDPGTDYRLIDRKFLDRNGRIDKDTFKLVYSDENY
jgi:hypothetical protein